MQRTKNNKIQKQKHQEKIKVTKIWEKNKAKLSIQTMSQERKK